jgi:hypothetical protein
MAEYYFTTADREEQLLQELVAALSRLIEHLQRESNLAASAAPYEVAREQALSLLSLGFTREQLLELSRAVPDLLAPYRYRDWDAPEEWEGWYGEVASALQSALNAAGELRAIGKRR